MIIKIYRHFMEDPLYRSSIFIILSTFVMAFFGFFFWILVARIFPTKSVGIATTLISVMGLLNSFSFLGFNFSLVRYLPKSNQRNDKINSSFILVIIVSIISSIFFILYLKTFSPHLLFLKTNILYILSFIIFIIGGSLSTIIDSIFIAYRGSDNILIKSTILSILKLAFPFIFIFLGSYGIFTSVAIATLISTIFGLTILIFKYHYLPSFSFKTNVIKEMAFFSGGNYIASFLSLAPSQVIPLLIINKLNLETAAYYYIASMILGFLTIISTGTTSSFLAEGSYNSEELLKHFIKALKFIYILLVPAIIGIFFFGNFILNAFGKNYAIETFTFLKIVSISAIFMAITSLVSSILRIRHQIKTLILVNALAAIIILGLCYIFLSYGLIGIGYGWILGQALVAIISLSLIFKDFIIIKSLKGLS